MADPAPPAWQPNIDQVGTIVRSAIKAVGWILATRGITLAPDVSDAFMGPNAVLFYTGIAMAVLPMIRDWYIHSRSGKLAAVEDMRGVVQIEVAHDAPADVKAIAANTDRPKVVLAP